MNNINNINNINLENQSLQELQKIKDERLAKSSALLSSVTNAAKGVAANALETVGDKLGVDITNPQGIDNALDNIKNSVTNPKNVEKTTEILKGLAQNAAVYYKAVEPVIDPMVDKFLEVSSKAAEKAGETATVVLSNAVKEIPGVGLTYSLVQDASKIGEAASAATNAFAEFTTTASDSAVVFKKNLERLKAEKSAIEARTNETLNQFQNPLQNLNINNNLLVGGKKRTSKKRSSKRGKKRNTKSSRR